MKLVTQNVRYFYFACFCQVFVISVVEQRDSEVMTARNGSRVEIPCNLDVPFTSKELEEMSWIKGSRQLLSRGIFRITEEQRISVIPPTILKKRAFNLLINPVNQLDSGIYRCSIEVDRVKHSRTVELNVLVPPRIVKSPAPTLKMVEGDTLQISCAAEGNPQPVVTWLMKPSNRSLHYSSPIGGRMSSFVLARTHLTEMNANFVEMNGYLQISMLNREMIGSLACEAGNGVDPKAIREMRLDIRFRPELVVSNSLIKQSLGRNTVLECQAMANPLGNFLWRFGEDDAQINASFCSIMPNKVEKYCLVETRPQHDEGVFRVISKLHIFNLADQDYGTYSCSMETMMGKTTASTTVMQYIPAFEKSIRIFQNNLPNLSVHQEPRVTASPLRGHNIETVNITLAHFHETSRDPSSAKKTAKRGSKSTTSSVVNVSGSFLILAFVLLLRPV